jgi:hypothetical protein
MIKQVECYFCNGTGKINDRSKITKKRIKKLIPCTLCKGTGLIIKDINVEALTKLKESKWLMTIEVEAEPLTIYFDKVKTISVFPIGFLYKKYDSYIFALIKEDKYTLVHIPTGLKIFCNIEINQIHNLINQIPEEIILKSDVYKYSEFFKTELIQHLRNIYPQYKIIKEIKKETKNEK